MPYSARKTHRCPLQGQIPARIRPAVQKSEKSGVYFHIHQENQVLACVHLEVVHHLHEME